MESRVLVLFLTVALALMSLTGCSRQQLVEAYYLCHCHHLLGNIPELDRLIFSMR